MALGTLTFDTLLPEQTLNAELQQQQQEQPPTTSPTPPQPQPLPVVPGEVLGVEIVPAFECNTVTSTNADNLKAAVVVVDCDSSCSDAGCDNVNTKTSITTITPIPTTTATTITTTTSSSATPVGASKETVVVESAIVVPEEERNCDGNSNNNATATKNRSNLYLIKSYSFIDKSSQALAAAAAVIPNRMSTHSDEKAGDKYVLSPAMEDFETCKILMLEQGTVDIGIGKTAAKAKEKPTKKAKEKDKEKEKEKEEKERAKERMVKEKAKQKFLKNEKKEQQKAAKKEQQQQQQQQLLGVGVGLHKSKSTSDAYTAHTAGTAELSCDGAMSEDLDDLHEFVDILRRPQRPKPQTLAISVTALPLRRDGVDEQQQQAQLSSNSSPSPGLGVFKRESFLRQSLQSIRRSFSTSHKKSSSAKLTNATDTDTTANSKSSKSANIRQHTAVISPTMTVRPSIISTTSASSSYSSASSTASSTGAGLAAPNAPESAVFNLCSSDDSADSEEGRDESTLKRNPLITLNDVYALHLNDDEQLHDDDGDEDEDDDAMHSDGHNGDGGGGDINAASIATRTDASTAAKQQPIKPKRAADKKRSTSSVSTLAYGSTATTATATATANENSMAPLQCHAEAQSLGELNAQQTTTTTAIESSKTTGKHKRPFVQQLSVPTSTSAYAQQQQQQSNNTNISNSSNNKGERYSDSYYATSSNNKNDQRSLKQTASAVSNNTLLPASSTSSSGSGSLRSASPTNRHTTAKHEQQTAASAAAAQAQAAGVGIGNGTGAGANATAATAAAAAAAASTGSATANAVNAIGGMQVTPPEKEKKRKEVSSSRVKKLHRHFAQVSKDEKLINYFSCALVSDILLQGHLYITDQHFAFYSNVFGYVTKVVIPTASVTKISKEKTAKIIPNAVGVATADERHVFGSFISREAAYRLMCSVCYTPSAPPEILPKLPADIEISEEYSIEDDSSCSISGNESPPQQNGAAAAAVAAAAAGTAAPAGVQLGGDGGQTLLRRNVISSSVMVGGDGKRAAASENQQQRLSDIPVNAKTVNSSASNASPIARGTSSSSAPLGITADTTTGTTTTIPTSTSVNASVSSTPSSSSTSTSLTTTTTTSSATTIMGGLHATTTNPKTVAHNAYNSFKNLTRNLLLRLTFPTDLNVVYLGVLLSLLLALFSVFLLYRILNIEAKTSFYHTPADFNWRTGNDDDIFAEALRWHRELQAKSTEEAQTILNTNLEQIAKVRRSLETLSMLIHDRSSAYGSTNRDDSD